MRFCSYAVALLLLALPGSALAEDKPAALPPELSWIPPNCTAFVHVRFAELWDSPTGKILRDVIAKSDPKAMAEIEKSIGVRLSQIDRITLLVPDFVDGGPERAVVLRVTTTEPYDSKRVITSLPIEQRENEELLAGPSRKSYRLHGGLVHLTDAKNLTLVFSEQAAVGLLGKLLERETTGGLSPALSVAAQNHQLVAALNVSHLRHLPIDQSPPWLRPLFDAQLAVVTGDLKPESADLELKLAFARKGHADDGGKALEAVKGEAMKVLESAITELMGDKEGAGRAKILGELVAALKNAKIETKDTQVIASASLKTSGPLATIAQEGIGAFSIASQRTQSQNNLKQIGLAMHNYHDTFGKLPAAAICDKNGKPLLSWRVAILPYIEQDNLYKQFKLDEPWDSEHNKKLAMVTVPIYALPGDKVKRDMPSTFYRVFYGNDAMFDLKNGTGFNQIADGLSNTLMVVEAGEAVPWTKPISATAATCCLATAPCAPSRKP
jgi:Protein of unknown function (DUF1559)